MKKMAKCNIDDCDLDTYSDESTCILHCEKGDYSTDFDKPGSLRLFHAELINYITREAFIYTEETSTINKTSLSEHLEQHDGEVSVHQDTFSKQLTVVFTNIFFPQRDSRDRFDYFRTLNKLGGLHFNYCKFTLFGLEITGGRCFYQDCIFLKRWHIYNTPILGNVNGVLYQSCLFHENAYSYSEDNEKVTIESSLFNDCEFNNTVDFENIEMTSPIFNNTDGTKLKINTLRLVNCTVQDRFALNDCTINLFISENNVFNSKFELKNNIIQEFNVSNTNHLKLFDSYGTKYRKFNIEKSIFDDFAGFEKCEFGEHNDPNPDLVATFMYATFLNFVNFRNTTFHSGLDIEHINLKESPNFLNTNINSAHSNRETFRIIKHSFDKIGNHIEANRFFVYEMKKYKEELTKSNLFQERIILFLNEKISNFGQSFLTPIFWMVVASILYSLLILGYESNSLYKVYPPINNALSTVSGLSNSAAENILPFKKLLKDGMEFISLCFYVVFASLIWQTIVAVKRHTKR